MLVALLLIAAMAQPAPDPPPDAVEVHETGKPIGELPADRFPPPISCCMSRAFIARPIEARTDEIRACWDGMSEKHRRESVKRYVRFWVDQGASVIDSVEVKGEPHPVDECLTAVFERLEYPAAAPCRFGATYPVVFEPTQAGSRAPAGKPHLK